MELLVVLGVVSTVVVSATDIFMLTSKSQRKIFGLERTQADARYTMETIAREIRNGRVDYASYAGGTIASPVEDLALIDSTNTVLHFQKSTVTNESFCQDQASRPCLLVSSGANSPSPLTPQGVTVANLKFYISPSVDPFNFDVATGGYLANAQPRVTIVLVLQSTAIRVGEQASVIYTQTTVASRAYRR